MHAVTADQPLALAAPSADDGIWAPARRRLTLGLVLTITLVAFEALAISTVMPVVAADLGGLGLYGWVFSGFFLGSLLGIVLAGRAADRRGTAAPFLAGLFLFAVGLLAGGLAPSMALLVAAELPRASAQAPSRPSPTQAWGARTRRPFGLACSRSSPRPG